MIAQKIIDLYEQTESIKATAAISGLSPQKVRRILITAGQWTSPIANKINQLYAHGKSISQIASALDIKEKTVIGYLPYSKGMYHADAPTKNALAIRRHRERRQG